MLYAERNVRQSVIPIRSALADDTAGCTRAVTPSVNALRINQPWSGQTYNYLHNTQGAEAGERIPRDAWSRRLHKRRYDRDAARRVADHG